MFGPVLSFEDTAMEFPDHFSVSCFGLPVERDGTLWYVVGVWIECFGFIDTSYWKGSAGQNGRQFAVLKTNDVKFITLLNCHYMI